MDFIQNLFNVFVINCEFAIFAFLGDRFPDFLAHKMPAFRTSYFTPTNNFQDAIAAKPDEVCHQPCLLVKIIRIPRLRGSASPS